MKRRRRRNGSALVAAQSGAAVLTAVAPALPWIVLALAGWWAWSKFKAAADAWSGDPRDPLSPAAAAKAKATCEGMWGKEQCDQWAAEYDTASKAEGYPATTGPYLPPTDVNWDEESSK